MTKNHRHKRKRDVSRAATIKETAEIVGVSPRMVQMVLNAERKNDEVLIVFTELTEGKNKLLNDVKKLIPLTPKNKK